MSKPSVLILKALPDEARRLVGEHCEVIECRESDLSSREELLGYLSDVEGFLQTDVQIDSELLAHAPKLRVVSNQSVGYNNFDTSAMKERGIIGTHTPYVLDDTVADLIFALMLSAARRVPELDLLVKQGKWAEMEPRRSSTLGSMSTMQRPESLVWEESGRLSRSEPLKGLI